MYLMRYLGCENFCLAFFECNFGHQRNRKAFLRITLPHICQTSIMECEICYNLNIHFPSAASVAFGRFRGTFRYYFARYSCSVVEYVRV